MSSWTVPIALVLLGATLVGVLVVLRYVQVLWDRRFREIQAQVENWERIYLKRIQELKSKVSKQEGELKDVKALSHNWMRQQERLIAEQAFALPALSEGSEEAEPTSRRLRQFEKRLDSIAEQMEKSAAGIRYRNEQIGELETRMRAVVRVMRKLHEEATRRERLLDEMRDEMQLRMALPMAGSFQDLELDEEKPASPAVGDSETRPEDEPDDLKKIHGIGPVFEQLLNENGVRTYRQIAGWDDRDVVRFAQLLQSSPSRIRRDDWVGGARQEHLRKYGSRS